MRNVVVTAILVVLCAAPESPAQDRLTRRFGTSNGLVPANVFSLAQDRTGFLWIGTADGLYRFDGVEMRRWAADLLRGRVVALASGPAGETLALAEHGALFAVDGDGLTPVPGDQESVTSAVGMAWDGAGCFWIARSRTLDVNCEAGTRRSFPRDRFDREPLHGLRSARQGVLVLTSGSVWRAAHDRAPERLAAIANPQDALDLGRGRTLIVSQSGRVVEATSQGATERFALAARGISLAVRGETTWVSFDRYLAALSDDRPPAVLGPAEGIDGGGPLLVDREGSLWLGTFTGLRQYPEPDAAIWRDRDGLPSAHARYLARDGDRVWVATWQGTGVLEPRDGHWDASAPPAWARSWGRVCRDGAGLVWMGLAPDLAAVRDGTLVRRFSVARTLFFCAAAADGGLWLATDGGLFRTRAGEAAIEPAVNLPRGEADAPVRAVLQDDTGRLWVSNDETVCQTDLRHSRWTCVDIDGAVHLTGLVQMPSGAIWAASERLGVLRIDEDGARPVPNAGALPSVAVLSLSPARTAGLWVAGHGIAHRVIEAADGGLEVVETLTAWHGLHTLAVHDVLEDDDGTVWLATFDGVVRVPATARAQDLAAPPVALIEGRVDRDGVPLDRAIELPSDRNRLELRFAALSYRDPGLLRLQVRSSSQAAWVDLRGTVFRWTDLPPGAYRAEVRASLDERRWTAVPATVAFRVSPPWWRRWWALALFALAAGACLVAVHRARLAFAVRLEHQRTRIAMDLHDQMGSALGTIGVLSGVLADQEPSGDRRQLAGDIAATASEAATTLSDIVWSLKPQPATLADLAARLAERGQRMFSATRAELDVRTPEDLSAVPLSLSVRRAVLLIGLEALTNAARHAGAQRVVLAFEPGVHGSWILTVRDDGVGLPDMPGAARGMGIANLHRRAAEIGARLELVRPASGGTAIVLSFRPAARGSSS